MQTGDRRLLKHPTTHIPCRYASLRAAKNNKEIKFISVQRTKGVIKFNRNCQECGVSAMSNAVHINACVFSRFTVVMLFNGDGHRKYSIEAVYAAEAMDRLWRLGLIHVHFL